jgi:hypothetical protein
MQVRHLCYQYCGYTQGFRENGFYGVFGAGRCSQSVCLVGGARQLPFVPEYSSMALADESLGTSLVRHAQNFMPLYFGDYTEVPTKSPLPGVQIRSAV